MVEAIFTQTYVVSECLHCGQSVPRGRKEFCCMGCLAVYRLLHDSGLDKYYQLRPSKTYPLLNYVSRPVDFAWVEQLPGFNQGVVQMDIEGLQCAACIWVICELAKKRKYARVDGDMALGRLCIEFDPQQFDLKEYLAELHAFGYRTGPLLQGGRTSNSSLLIRMGVCIAIAMNSMFLAISLYLGLNQNEPQLYRLFSDLNFYLSFLSVVVGGSYFFSRAIQSLKKKVLHFDLPIALGILFAFSGSVLARWQDRNEGTYFDTINIFISLMLVGRYVQNRVLQKNRNTLLSTQKLSDLKITRIGGDLTDISFDEIKKGDHLLVFAGGIVPVECILKKGKADLSLAWISGESMPKVFEEGESIPAGAHLLGQSAIEICAASDFNTSLLSLLMPKERSHEMMPFLWQWVTARYVVLVLSAALVAAIVWAFIDPTRIPAIVTSILVVTCPCSLGISIPLARTYAHRWLMLRGVFVRDGALLDKCVDIKNIVFDKTGTLTLATMEVCNPDFFSTLKLHDLQILYNGVARSRHPASQAVFQCLAEKKLPWVSVDTIEIAGEGLIVSTDKDTYRIGRFYCDWPRKNGSEYHVNFMKNNMTLGVITLTERLIEDTQSSINQLKKSGYQIYMMSGDQKNRVMAMAHKIEIPIDHVYAECSPNDKARYLSELDGKKSLMLGDGLNDSLAFGRARICGAPVWEKSTMAQNADFFYMAGHLRFLPALFQMAEKLKGVIRMNLHFALFYNLITISLCFLGLMTPVMTAILMPLGSVFILSTTFLRLRTI